jgi:hypothetical protein
MAEPVLLRDLVESDGGVGHGHARSSKRGAKNSDTQGVVFLDGLGEPDGTATDRARNNCDATSWPY